MFFVLSACTSLTPLGVKETEVVSKSTETGGKEANEKAEKAAKKKAEEAAKKAEAEKKANENDGKVQKSSQECHIVKDKLDGDKFITEVINTLETIKKLGGKSWLSSECKAIQSATIGKRTYRVDFSKEDVIINKQASGEMQELARLNWETDVTPKFLIVLRSAIIMAQKKMESSSETDKLSIFEWSFPGEDVKDIDLIPGTEQIKGGYSGRSYTTIDGDHVYWTTEQKLKLTGNAADLIVYQPKEEKKLTALAQLFSMN